MGLAFFYSSHSISYFYFGRDFGGVEAKNICICLDYFVIFLSGFFGINNTLFAKADFYLS